MNDDPSRSDPGDAPPPRRLFLLEPGWRVGQKVGSSREFCYMMAPGQDYYHRVYDGEILLQRGDERLCMACAERRGLLAFTPKSLRDSSRADAELDLALEDPVAPLELDLERDLRGRPNQEADESV